MHSLNLEVGMKVLVLNQYGQGKYNIAASPFLSKGIALIYSGSPYDFKDKYNVNIFTPDIPEKLGFSGTYNSAIIEIKRIKDK